MSGAAGKFLPRVRPESQAWWEACREGRLMLQHCRSCDRLQFYPRIVCTHCAGRDLGWKPSGGRATVRSFTVCRLPVSPAYAADVPYIIVLVDLEEGPSLMSRLVGCEPESAAIGMAVEVCFEQWSEEFTMPLFRPAAAGESP